MLFSSKKERDIFLNEEFEEDDPIVNGEEVNIDDSKDIENIDGEINEDDLINDKDINEPEEIDHQKELFNRSARIYSVPTYGEDRDVLHDDDLSGEVQPIIADDISIDKRNNEYHVDEFGVLYYSIANGCDIKEAVNDIIKANTSEDDPINKNNFVVDICNSIGLDRVCEQNNILYEEVTIKNDNINKINSEISIIQNKVVAFIKKQDYSDKAAIQKQIDRIDATIKDIDEDLKSGKYKMGAFKGNPKIIVKKFIINMGKTTALGAAVGGVMGGIATLIPALAPFVQMAIPISSTLIGMWGAGTHKANNIISQKAKIEDYDSIIGVLNFYPKWLSGYRSKLVNLKKDLEKRMDNIKEK